MREAFAPASQAVRSILERSDYWRRSPATAGGSAGHKEWSYFCVFGESVTLIANFSIMDHPSLTGRDSGRIEDARVAVLAREVSGRWHGGIDQYAPESVSVPAGKIAATFGQSSLAFDEGVYRLRLRTGTDLEADLSLKPQARPAVTRSVPLGMMEPMRWLVVPRLTASGDVRLCGRHHHISGCPAYHDHNWGRFAWGGDFAWEWGIALTSASSTPWSLIYYRITDRGRHQAISQGLLLWRHAYHSRTFQDREIQVRSLGLLRPTRPLRVPGIAALAIPGTAADIPQAVTVQANSENEEFEVTFELDNCAQIAVPNDSDGGFTAIWEVHGRARATGTIRGEKIEFNSPAVVEFNRAA
jgi:hypothetical protein